MKDILLSLVLSLTVTCSGLWAQSKPAVAVMDLEVVGIKENISLVLSNLVRQELIKSGKFKVVDRNNMEAILKEQDFQLTDVCNTSECIVEVGKVLGVQKMVFGTIGKLGTKYLIDLQLIDVGSGQLETVKNISHVGKLEDLDGPIRQISRSLAGLKALRASGGQYKIYITSEPSGANVSIEDELKGSTPLMVVLQSDRKVTVGLTARNYQKWFQAIQPKLGETVIVRGKLLEIGAEATVQEYKMRYIEYQGNRVNGWKALRTGLTVGLLLPGAGHYQARNFKMAGLQTLIGYGSIFLSIKTHNDFWPVLYLANYAVDVIDTPFAVRRYNKTLKRKLGIVFAPAPGLQGARLAIVVQL